jgi:hypothetical protein
MSEMVLLCHALDGAQAAILVAELEGRDIPTRLVGSQGTMAMGGVPVPEAIEVEVWVPADRIELARRILEERRLDSARFATDLSSWTCAACGESNDGGFELCWNCQTPRSADRPA